MHLSGLPSVFFFSSRRRHTRWPRDWSSDVCSSDLLRDERPARPGRPLELTLDAAIQDKAEDVLEKVGRQFRPKGATALVMDPRTGELLAVANWPRVNANAIGAAPGFARQNRAVGASYEPGSTFKAFT